MTITAIEEQKKNKDRRSIFIDGDFAFGISAQELAFTGLKEGDEISPKALDKIKQTAVLADAKNLAFKYLSHSMRTKREVRQKLKTYDFEEDLIEEVIAFLESHRYIDDASYAEKYIEEKLRHSYGRERIKRDLYLKGIDSETISSCLEELHEDPTEKILQLLEKKIKSETKEEFNKKERQKIYNFLNSRGFGYDEVKGAIGIYWEN
ncbi:MAG: RecX family transcriptional regulator [Defluviitaleaceae bacterium]|nr:RecX family transcriptional regulator [Defluviitaleaceae bacterium]